MAREVVIGEMDSHDSFRWNRPCYYGEIREGHRCLAAAKVLAESHEPQDVASARSRVLAALRALAPTLDVVEAG